MYYLEISAASPRMSYPYPHSNTHGPFASEQEAYGFFTKLQIWYPLAMQDAAYRITVQKESSHHTNAPDNTIH